MKRTEAEYGEYMDALLARVGAVLDGEHSYNVAGIGFVIMIQAMASLPATEQKAIRQWMEETLDRPGPSLH